MLTGIEGWTYGAEHELGDWDRRDGVPLDFKLDERDVTMVNSNGIAVDPKARTYPFGGEFNTPPTTTIQGQAECLRQITYMHPRAVVNYRSNLHCHVRVPGLSENLGMLKTLARYNLKWLPEVLPLIEPIPKPTREAYPEREEFEGAHKRYLRRRKSHQTKLTPARVKIQLRAKTVKEFHDLGVPQSKDGKPLPFCQPRCAVNIRQLLETDTIEFRHFPGTLDGEELTVALEWCREYLRSAFAGRSPVSLYKNWFAQARFPKFQPYVHWMEQRYLRTCYGHDITIKEINANVDSILREDTRNEIFSYLSR
ncbi:MAG: hypothetical protein DRQ48_00185 [Gammaproteobacteria bacterium]|nr:MAG: hypothetical protein DRQ48_00185 [Gammaproteobacteria bacterium]